MLTTISTLLVLAGSIVDGVVTEKVKEGATASVLGIQTLQMGVFGGIIAGLCAAELCNRFYSKKAPRLGVLFSLSFLQALAGASCAFLTLFTK